MLPDCQGQEPAAPLSPHNHKHSWLDKHSAAHSAPYCSQKQPNLAFCKIYTLDSRCMVSVLGVWWGPSWTQGVAGAGCLPSRSQPHIDPSWAFFQTSAAPTHPIHLLACGGGWPDTASPNISHEAPFCSSWQIALHCLGGTPVANGITRHELPGVPVVSG